MLSPSFKPVVEYLTDFILLCQGMSSSLIYGCRILILKAITLCRPTNLWHVKKENSQFQCTSIRERERERSRVRGVGFDHGLGFGLWAWPGFLCIGFVAVEECSSRSPEQQQGLVPGFSNGGGSKLSLFRWPWSVRVWQRRAGCWLGFHCWGWAHFTCPLLGPCCFYELSVNSGFFKTYRNVRLRPL